MENIHETSGSPVETPKRDSLLINSMRYGLYTAGAYILVLLVLYAMSVGSTNWLNYITLLVIAAGIFWGTRVYRDKHNQGFLSYGRSLGSGVLISLFAGVIIAIYTYLFYTYFDTSAMAKLLEEAELKLLERGLTDEQVDQAMVMTSKMMSPGFMSLSVVFSTVLWGTLFSLIIAIFVRKEDNSFDAAFKES